MRAITITLLLLVLGASLVQAQDLAATPPLLDGTYDGLYTRIDGASHRRPVETTGRFEFVVDGDRYWIDSSTRYAPPGGHGRLVIGEVVTLVDEGRHTAEFDTSLIVQGPFAWQLRNGVIVLEQEDPERDRVLRLELERR